MLYTNGNVPESVVSVVLGSGHDSKGRYWEWRLTPATAARWAAAVRYAQTKWGRVMRITRGANGYRPRAWQIIARNDACASGNCNGAAAVGSSSHGGNWRGRDCLAIDVDRNGLTWAQVWEACTAAGFQCGLITAAISGIPGGEPWHIIDFNAFGPTPAGTGSTTFTEGDELNETEKRQLASAAEDAGIIKQLLSETVQWKGIGQLASETRTLAGTILQVLTETEGWTGIDTRVSQVLGNTAQILAAVAESDARDAARDAALKAAVEALAAGSGVDPAALASLVTEAAAVGAQRSLADADFPTEESIAAAVITDMERARLVELEAEVARLRDQGDPA